ncbi:hypothetical protein FJU30_16365 [Affinibrenneria salicis]|uniref:Outer membrane assembly lipoprotein YfiO n=1 Tax=Affinibrenneria salicis TaxID=2590031 RepID=A0A5J5FXW2_9GAMM|nr:hypothetical protein [Affinibrenneria salicis]KAA8998573.1 hypothetical protein FJU30_16365 [Affinibrenneria salicis]
MKGTTALAGCLTLLLSGQAFASADDLCGFSDTECGMSAQPWLAPDNDTRTNLILLQAGRNGIPLPVPQPLPDQARTRIDPFTAWRVMGLAATVEPTPDAESEQSDNAALANAAQALGLSQQWLAKIAAADANEGEGREVSNTPATATDFLHVLGQDAQLNGRQRSTLALYRIAMLPDDEFGDLNDAMLDAVPDDGHAGEFKRYLLNAVAFYESAFAQAEQGFQALSQASQPWVAETARYMLIRVAIGQAMQNALDEYNMFDPGKADKQAAQRAIARIDEYLQRYPQGRYASSAQGLYRRAYWIAGDIPALAGIYSRTLAQSDDIDTLQSLSDEIDNKLLENSQFTLDADNPALMLIQDLKRLRSERSWNNLPPLTDAELSAQQPLFEQAGMAQEARYLLAAWQFFRRGDNEAVLTLTPASAPADLTASTAFSLQVLRGKALHNLKRWQDAETHWRHLLTRKVNYTQQQYLQLALAETLVSGGRPERVFAADSPITNLRFRSAVLKTSADAQLLRQQVEQAPSQEEQAIALHTLLSKDLSHGDYRGWLRDSAWRTRIPPLINTENASWNMENLQDFDWDGGDTEEGYQCPALTAVVTALSQRPGDARALNCLGEFYLRTDNQVGFDWGEDNALQGLTQAPQSFAGQLRNRLDDYMQVIADAKAPPEDKSYALYRAIYCYAPSGYNGCGSQTIDKATRRAWFTQLKREFKGSQWADQLRYYW